MRQEPKKVDLEAAGKDYAAGMTTRAMGLKYGCDAKTIRRWAKKYEWKRDPNAAPKKRPMAPRGPEPRGKPVDEIEEREASSGHVVLSMLAGKIMERVAIMLEGSYAATLTPKDIRSLAGALLDVRTLINAVSPLEEQEQRLKLAALQRDLDKAREDSNSKTVTVRFESPEIEDLSV